VKIKLDENLGEAGATFLKAAGCDVVTVAEQRLLSAPDADIVRVCRAEQRCLVTLDKDFSDPVRKRACKGDSRRTSRNRARALSRDTYEDL
jgi:predicted nuclease of predicted toxin-antitoxin system